MVEHQLPKLRVAGSIPVVRFSRSPAEAGFLDGNTNAVKSGSTARAVECSRRERRSSWDALNGAPSRRRRRLLAAEESGSILAALEAIDQDLTKAEARAAGGCCSSTKPGYLAGNHAQPLRASVRRRAPRSVFEAEFGSMLSQGRRPTTSGQARSVRFLFELRCLSADPQLRFLARGRTASGRDSRIRTIKCGVEPSTLTLGQVRQGGHDG